MFYAVTSKAIREKIQSTYPKARSNESGMNSNDLPGYLLWMTGKLDGMDRASIKDALKAARWLGWVLFGVEHLGLWDNAISRDLVREDVRQGNDRPLEG